MKMTTCSECGEPLVGSPFNCHHHNQTEESDDVGNTVVQCEDCPAWWIIANEVPC